MNKKAGNHVTKKQSAKKAPPKARRAPRQRKTSYSRVVQFPEVRGLTVEKVALSTDSDFPCVSIRFQDNTDLTVRSEEHTSELQSQFHLVCRLLLEKKNT